MKIHTIVSQLVIAIVLAAPGATFGTIVEVGDLNIIDDLGNPSDGLRFLDMTFSDGLSKSAALTNAQATYSNARLATPAEFDDLFAAAGIGYSGSLTASSAFDPGGDALISSDDVDVGALALSLGYTVATTLVIWTDPDGSNSAASTRDYMFTSNGLAVVTYNNTLTPPVSNVGWLLVSESVAAVPEPSSLIMWCVGAVGWLVYGSRRKRKRSSATS